LRSGGGGNGDDDDYDDVVNLRINGGFDVPAVVLEKLREWSGFAQDISGRPQSLTLAARLSLAWVKLTNWAICPRWALV
jgi:hypothetical protein